MRITVKTITQGERVEVDDPSPMVFAAGFGKFRWQVGHDHQIYFTIEEWEAASAEVKEYMDAQEEMK